MAADIAHSEKNANQLKPYWHYFGLNQDPFSLSSSEDNLPAGQWSDELELIHRSVASHDVLVFVARESQVKTPLELVQNHLQANFGLHRLEISSQVDPFECLSMIQQQFGFHDGAHDDLSSGVTQLLSSIRKHAMPSILLVEKADVLPEKTLLLLVELIKQQRLHESANLKIILFGSTHFDKVLSGLLTDETAKNCVQIVKFTPFGLNETSQFLKQCLQQAGSDKLLFSKQDVVYIHQQSQGNRRKIKTVARELLIAKVRKTSSKTWYHDPMTIASLSMIGFACIIYAVSLARQQSFDHQQRESSYQLTQSPGQIQEAQSTLAIERPQSSQAEDVMVYDDQTPKQIEALLKASQFKPYQTSRKERIYPDLPHAKSTHQPKYSLTLANHWRDIANAGHVVQRKLATWLPVTTSTSQLVTKQQQHPKVTVTRSDEKIPELQVARRLATVKQVGQFVYAKLEDNLPARVERVIDYTTHHPLAEKRSAGYRLVAINRAQGMATVSQYLANQSEQKLQNLLLTAYQKSQQEQQQARVRAQQHKEQQRIAAQLAAHKEQERLARVAREKARFMAALQREKLAQQQAEAAKRLRAEQLAQQKARQLAALKQARAKRLAKAKQVARRKQLLAAVKAEMQQQSAVVSAPASRAQPQRHAEVAVRDYQQPQYADPDSLDSFQDLDEMQPLAEAKTYSNEIDDRIIEVFQQPKVKRPTQVAKPPVTRRVFQAAKPKVTRVATVKRPKKPHFTLQIASVSNPDTLQQLVKQYQIPNTRTLTVKRRHKTAHILVYGDYPNRQTAKRQLKSLPKEIQTLHPWVRDLNELQNPVA